VTAHHLDRVTRGAEQMATARDAGHAALKTIVADRGGLDLGAVDDASLPRDGGPVASARGVEPYPFVR
jgi:hypothetical protein